MATTTMATTVCPDVIHKVLKNIYVALVSFPNCSPPPPLPVSRFLDPTPNYIMRHTFSFEISSCLYYIWNSSPPSFPPPSLPTPPTHTHARFINFCLPRPPPNT